MGRVRDGMVAFNRAAVLCNKFRAERRGERKESEGERGERREGGRGERNYF
jgi:hypothetical protein